MKGNRNVFDVKGKNVFLSGPMTGLDNYNVAAFCVAHAELKDAGAAYVMNPALGYLTKSVRKCDAMSHEDWVADCLHELTAREKRSQEWVDVIPLKYDVVVQLDGWEQSDGAIVESQVAHAVGIPCVSMREVSGVK
jgi:hypothetical protein